MRVTCTLAASLLFSITGCSEAPPVPETTAPRPPVEIEARIDKAVATTGDLLTFTIDADFDSAFEVDFPEIGTDIAGFRIVDTGREEPEEVRGRTRESRWYELRADLVGSYILPPVAVAYRAGGQEADEPWQVAETSEIFVEVESVLPEGGEVGDIRGLKDLRRVERPLPWVWIAGGLAALAALVALAWNFRRRRTQRPGPPPRPAHEVAFEALQALQGMDTSDPEVARRFHFRLSEILRTYLEARYGVNATDLTSEEIELLLAETEPLGEPAAELATLPAQEARRLRRFLRATDRVKFADHQPAPEETQAALDDARAFVEATRERPQDTAPAATSEAPQEMAA